VKPESAERLRCPRCRTGHALDLAAEAQDEREVREGMLRCRSCGYEARVEQGIADLLFEPPEFVVREAAGLARFADLMRSDGWSREDVVRLPEGGDGYWYAQAVLMDQVQQTVPMEPGQRLLDIGSNTCWASAAFAARGLDVTALDISEHEMQGLRTADWQFEAKSVYFERVLGVMFDLPFADESFDFVWACEVLHHNHRANLARTYAELYRVLRPGGTLIVCNEPLRTVKTPKLDPGSEVAEFEGHEHAYMRFSYTRLARRAGFDIDVRGPWYHGMFRPHGVGLGTGMTDAQIARAALTAMAMRRPWLVRTILALRAYVVGGTALHMLATKP
jgi:SAM-dependent methyltransferase